MDARQIARYETCQNVIRVLETDVAYNGEKLYVIESEHKLYKRIYTRYANETQLYSILKTYKLIGRRFKL